MVPLKLSFRRIQYQKWILENFGWRKALDPVSHNFWLEWPEEKIATTDPDNHIVVIEISRRGTPVETIYLEKGKLGFHAQKGYWMSTKLLIQVFMKYAGAKIDFFAVPVA